MVPPIKPPSERFAGYVKELNAEVGSTDIADETHTWVSKLIESVICDLPVIDLSRFESLKTVEELVRFVRDQHEIINAIESLVCKMVSLEQSRKYQNIKNASMARRLLNEGKKLGDGKRFNAALVKLNEVRYCVTNKH